MVRRHGFTLIELLVVLAVVAMLLSLVAPRYMRQVDRSREAALRQDLATLRTALDQYRGDKGYFPETLDALVQARYLRAIPADPLTGSRTSWHLSMAEEDGRAGIADVASGAPGRGLDGTAYGSW